MSPIQRFREARYAVEEISVYRYRMEPPQIGDLIQREGYGDCRVTRVRTRPVDERDIRAFDARPDLGDFMVMLEYEPLPPSPEPPA